MSSEVERLLFTVEDYHRMAAAGILSEDDRLELLEGEIVRMAPVGGRHIAAVAELTRLLGRQLPEELRLLVQSPVRLGTTSEPQPDLAVVHAAALGEDPPGPHDVLLVVEVADTSLRVDREVKLPLYGRAGIPEAWLVDLQGGRVERHTEPTPRGYRRLEVYDRGEELASASLPGIRLPVDAVLR